LNLHRRENLEASIKYYFLKCCTYLQNSKGKGNILSDVSILFNAKESLHTRVIYTCTLVKRKGKIVPVLLTEHDAMTAYWRVEV